MSNIYIYLFEHKNKKKCWKIAKFASNFRIIYEENDFYHSNHKFIRFQILQGLVAYNGFFTTTVLTDYCFGLGGVIIGTALGAYVFKHIPNRIFRYIVYAYIGLSSVIIFLTN